MAYRSKDLCVLAYANGFTMWVYNPEGEDMAAIAAADYFNPAADMLRPGDWIVVSTAQEGVGSADILHVCGVGTEGDGRVDVESITVAGLLHFGVALRPMDNHGPKAAH